MELLANLLLWAIPFGAMFIIGFVVGYVQGRLDQSKQDEVLIEDLESRFKSRLKEFKDLLDNDGEGWKKGRYEPGE